MSLVFGASRNISFNKSNHILKFFTKGFENLPIFFLISKIYYQVLSSARGCIYTSLFITYNKMADNNGTALFHMKQISILVRTVFVKLIYLSGDLKTINCHINFLDYYLRQRSVPPVSAIICRPEFPYLIEIHLRIFMVLHGYFSLSR